MEAFFNPRSVVLIGVSRHTGVGAYNGLEMMQRYGYRGKIFVVHPEAGEILGHRAYRQVRELPEVPDLAVLALGRDRLLGVVEECLAKGLRRFIIISQGLADADLRGREIQEEIVARAKATGAKIVGPNTMGVLNAFTGFSTAFVDLPRHPEPPPVTLIAQSGAPQVGAESFVGPLGQAIDLGNAADVDFVEVLEYLEHDAHTKVIAIHMEGLRRGRRFLSVAGRVNRRKPIVILKTGRSAAAAQAALSHTGSLVGADEVFSAAFARAGLTRVRDTTDFLDTVQAFRKLPRLKGRRIGIATPSGALGIMAVDALTQEELAVGPLPPRITAQVEPLGPAWHRLHNPVDLWPIGMKTGDYLALLRETLVGFLQHPDIDGAVAMLPALSSPLHRNIIAAAEFMASLELARYAKPLVVSVYGDYREKLRQELEEVPGVACYFAVERGIRALGHLYRYHQATSRPLDTWESRSSYASSPENIEQRLTTGGAGPNLLLGREALDFLAGYNLPVLPGVLAAHVDEAVKAAEELGYPVVMKVISPAWLHKTERGGVILHLSDETLVRQAFATLASKVKELTPEAPFWGLLVQKQVSGREVLLGIKQDATFGPVVVCGLGGVQTELWQDVAQSLAPINREEAFGLLASLKSYPLLTGYRGEAAVNLEALALALCRLSHLALAEPDLVELDINPLIATPEGCWAVDARAVFREGRMTPGSS